MPTKKHPKDMTPEDIEFRAAFLDPRQLPKLSGKNAAPYPFLIRYLLDKEESEKKGRTVVKETSVQMTKPPHTANHVVVVPGWVAPNSRFYPFCKHAQAMVSAGRIVLKDPSLYLKPGIGTTLSCPIESEVTIAAQDVFKDYLSEKHREAAARAKDSEKIAKKLGVEKSQVEEAVKSGTLSNLLPIAGGEEPEDEDE